MEVSYIVGQVKAHLCGSMVHCVTGSRSSLWKYGPLCYRFEVIYMEVWSIVGQVRGHLYGSMICCGRG